MILMASRRLTSKDYRTISTPDEMRIILPDYAYLTDEVIRGVEEDLSRFGIMFNCYIEGKDKITGKDRRLRLFQPLNDIGKMIESEDDS